MIDVRRDTPVRPERLAPGGGDKPRRSMLPVLIFVFPLITIVVGLVVLTGRAGLLMLLAVASVPGFILLHYLLWGRWLARTLRESRRTEDEEDETDR